MALNAAHTNAFVGLAIDGKQKKIAQTANLWSIMRGNAADTDTPTVTLDFDFVWQVCVSWAVCVGWGGGVMGVGVGRCGYAHQAAGLKECQSAVLGPAGAVSRLCADHVFAAGQSRSN